MKDIYFDENYGKPYEKIEKGKAIVFECKTKNGSIINQFIKRKIPIEIDNSIYYDIITPYGYGGPIITECTGSKEELLQEYEEKFSQYCKENNVVSKFVRFHPIYKNYIDFKEMYNAKFNRYTLATNLKDYDDPVMKEIGSEFWKIESENLIKKDNLKYFENLGLDVKYLMSGRAAIDYVLEDVKDDKKIVYMPDYCCNSMVQPFIDKGYNIKYYNVDLMNNKFYIDIQFNCSIFFGMSYLGYSNSNMDYYIKKFKMKSIAVIEDITHRVFCKKSHCESSNYLIASLRKWFPIYTREIAINKNCNFKKNIDNYTINEELVKCKKLAMQLKREYIYNENIDCKDMFLDLFNKSNKLITDYKNRKMDDESLEILKRIDLEDIIRKRIDNSKTIEKNFVFNDNVKMLYNYKDGDCPLFVPIILKNRDYIRKIMYIALFIGQILIILETRRMQMNYH